MGGVCHGGVGWVMEEWGRSWMGGVVIGTMYPNIPLSSANL